ncbi:hypothetical protein WEB32_31620 [Streptomyces netropsis]|uniref:hypothetical protein n=1 Tax=Streptomyces netropsis TaxID=55404 RepID=UPI0030D40C7B
MPGDPPTTRLALYKSKSDGSELVNYTQDIGQNLDKLDLAAGFQVVTSGTRPSSPYSGKPIAESDTSYRTCFSNGTAPASASWVEIPNSSGTFGQNLKLASGKQININSSGSSASLAVVNAAAGTDLISGRVSGDSQDRLLVDTDGTLNWGSGSATPDTNLYRSAANTLKTDDAFITVGNVTVGGDLKLANGTLIYRPKLFGGSVTLANSTSETVLASYTIPANDAVVGACYRIEMWGQAGCTGTPTLTFRGRISGVGGTNLSPNTFTFASGVTSKQWRVSLLVTCTLTGASGTWASSIVSQSSIPTSGSSSTDCTVIADGTAGAVRDTTVSSDLVITGLWSAASASNSLTMEGHIAERVA